MRSDPPSKRSTRAHALDERRRAARRLGGLSRRVSALVAAASGGSALLPALVVAGALGVAFALAWTSLRAAPLSFLGGRSWDPSTGVFGALPLLAGTALTTTVAIVLASPVAIGAAFFLGEVAPRESRPMLDTVLDLANAIPSVVWGLFALDVVLPSFARHLFPLLYGDRAGEVSPGGYGLLSGGVVLAAMIVPTIAGVAREVVRAVPTGDREAAIALGATRWEVVSLVVLPAVRAGLAGAVLLGLGRAVGEATVMSMILGSRVVVPETLASPGATASSLLLEQLADATDPPHVAALGHVALALLTASILSHALARVLVARSTAARTRSAP
jgi:phosphate transport system permease protein